MEASPGSAPATEEDFSLVKRMSIALGFGGAAEGGGAAAAAAASAGAGADDEPSVFKRMSTAVGGAADAVQAAVANVTGSDDAEGPIKTEGQCLRDGPSCHSAAAYAALAGGAPLAFCDKTTLMPPRFAEEGLASEEGCAATTLNALFADAAAKAPDAVALQVERPCPPLVKGSPPPPALPLAEWKKWTFAEYYAETRVAARAFMALGLERFEGVNIFGFNSPEWFMGEMAAIMAGGVAAGIYPTDTPDQVEYKSRHSAASIAVVEDEAKLAVFAACKANLPALRAIVVWNPLDAAALKDFDGVKVVAWSDLAALADGVPEADLDARIAAQEPGHVCTYIYTSGTTGNPKAVMISHDNIIFESSCVLHHLPFLGAEASDEERVISFLPLSHVAGMMVDIITPLVLTAKRPGTMSVGFARAYDLKAGSVGDRLRAIRPTLFLGVPRVWEKIAEKMKAVGAATKGLKKKVSTWAKGLGLEYQRACQMGGSGETPFGYSMAESVVLSKVKAALGLDACKFGFTGAAPISTDTLEYFGSLGIQINEVYGMSECTGATTFSTDAAHVWGSCGWTAAGMEVKIFQDGGSTNVECPAAASLFAPTEAEQGEVCFRGRHIMMGYMANPDLGKEHVAEIEKKTAEAIDGEGWLHSGDKGCMDARGMLRITGRYKELIIGAGGENIAPVPIEDQIKKLCQGVSNVMMIGDKRKFNVALVTLKAKGATGELPGGDELDGDALKLAEGVTTISAAVKSEAAIKAITDAIVATNADGAACPSNAAKVQKFTILAQDFSSSTGELTPTLKTKRSVVEKMNAAAIEKVYASKETFVPTF